jgi:hypothetical protein
VTEGAWRKYGLIGSIALYVIACVTPALILHVKRQLGAGGSRWDGRQSVYGVNLLVSGLALGWVRLNFTAFANLPLWTSWIFLARRRFQQARVLALVALFMSLETLQLVVQPYLWDESGTTEGYLAAPHIGVICWIGSMLVVAFTSSHLVRNNAQVSS